MKIVPSKYNMADVDIGAPFLRRYNGAQNFPTQCIQVSITTVLLRALDHVCIVRETEILKL